MTLEGYTADLDQANSNAMGALSLLPDIQRASERFARLAEDERASGALTGTTGSGSVVQLLSQMSAQMRELEATIQGSRETVANLFEQGQQHLATMRGLVSAPGAISIDLLPAALVGIMAVVYGAMRRGEEMLTDVDRISAGDMLRALDIQEALAAKRRAADKTEAVPSQPGEVAAEDEPPSRPAPAENVTPLTLGDRKRGET